MNYKLLQRAVGAGLLSGALFLSGVAHAALVTNKVPLLGYANQVLKVYRAPGNMQTSISIPAKTALIQIMQIRTDGWAYGSYPISGGRRANGWFKISDIQPYINFKNWETKSLYDNYRVERVADYSGLKGSNGNISRSDAVLVVGQQGQMLQIIYKQKNSANWRIGWVSEKAVQRVQVGTTVTQNKMQAQVQRTQTATSAKQSVTTTPNSNTLQNKQNANAVKTTNTTNVAQQNNSKTTSNTNAGKLILVDSPMTKITTNSSSGIGTPYRPNVGDLNGDGQITITDLSKINAHNIGLELIDPKYLDNADMNGDGAITITDVSNLKMVQIGNDNIEIYRRRPFKIKAKQRVNAYSTPTLTNWDGYSSVFKDDLIYIFAESGNAYHVKYPTSKGEKTMWVSKDVLNTVSTSASIQDALNWCAGQVNKKVGTGQCVAFVNAYYKYLGTNAVSGDGKDFAENVPSGWKSFPNGVPQPGDVLVYKGAWYGHVAIYAGNNTVYQQNYNYPKQVEKTTNWSYNRSWYSKSEGGLKKYYWGCVRLIS